MAGGSVAKGSAAMKMDDLRITENRMRRARVIELAKWSHKNEGTPETHAHFAKTREGAIARLHSSGAIDAEQLGWACEIASVAEGIERDVEVRIINYEPRIDQAASGRNALVEGIMRVRRELAYGRWRRQLPMPKRLVLDMVVGDAIPFSTAGRRYGMHPRKARTYLIAAIDRWPDCLDWACKQVDKDDLEAAHKRLMR